MTVVVEIKCSMACDVYTGHYFQNEVMRKSSNPLDGFKWISEREAQFDNRALLMSRDEDHSAFVSGFGGDTFIYRLVAD